MISFGKTMSETKNSSKHTTFRIDRRRLRLLERLTQACAVSGDEGEVRQIIQAELKGMTDEIRIDPLGNLLCIRRSRQPGAVRVMLAAHMDEIGLMLTAINGKGMFRFETVGGVNWAYLPGKAIWVGARPYPRGHRCQPYSPHIGL